MPGVIPSSYDRTEEVGGAQTTGRLDRPLIQSGFEQDYRPVRVLRQSGRQNRASGTSANNNDVVHSTHVAHIGAATRPGSSQGASGTSAAKTSSDMPTARENAAPCRQTFSIKITPASATMTATFIAPTATSTIMSPQQQPTQ